MKALKILGLVLSLSGCIYAGEYNLFPWRNDVIAGLSGYQIEYLDKREEHLLNSETLHESSFTANKLLTAHKGYPIVDTKSYMKNYYVQESLIAPQNAIMTSGITPAKVTGGKKYDVIGRVKIDGNIYYLIDSDSPSTVFLVDEDYRLQKHIGAVKGDKLVLIKESFAVTPENFQFEPVTKSRVLQSDMVKGFEIKFEGVENNIMRFTLMNYDNGGFSGEFVDYNFENEPGIVEIAGVEIRVFSATDEKLEYMILAEE
ncbi:MAG: hypothetical protein IJ689_01820 [Alphaproteobacteria bacterium]|nr:hypothetical protein [Alphaproteobacteria bacterium]